MEYKLRDYMEELTNPTLAPYAKNGECLVRVTASAPTREKAEKMMAPVIERVKGMSASWPTAWTAPTSPSIRRS